MNKIYKTIYNFARKCIVVCNEQKHIRKSNNRSNGSVLITTIILLGLSASTDTSAKVTIAGVRNTDQYSSDEGNFSFFNSDYSSGYPDFYLHQGRFKTVGSFTTHKDVNIPTGREDTYYFGTGKDFNNAFGNLEVGESTLFIERIFGQTTTKGENIVSVTYSALKKTGENQFTEIKSTTEEIRCLSTDHNCLNFVGRLNGSNKDDINKIQKFSSQLIPKLKGPTSNALKGEVLDDFRTSLRLTGVADGEISASSFDAVNGSQLFKVEQQLQNLGQASEYINVNATDTVASPTTSAKAKGARATAVGEAAVADGNESLAIGHNATTQAAANNSVALGANSQATEADVVSIGNTTLKRRITNLADGITPSDAATVGQVTTIAKDAVIVADGSNTTVTIDTANGKNTYKVDVEANGAIADGDNGIVNGSTVATETRVQTDGNSIRSGQSAAKNLSNLDRDIGTLSTKVAQHTTQLNNKVNVDQVGGLVADSLKSTLKGSDFVTVEPTLNGTDVVLAVKSTGSDKTLDTTNKGNRLVTSVTLDSLLTAQKTEANQIYAQTNASNIDENAWLAKLGTQAPSGAISSTNTHFVSGNQVFAEVRPVDGTHVKNANSTAKNLNDLDTQVVKNSTQIAQNTTNLASKVDRAELGTAISENFEIKSGASGLVSVKPNEPGQTSGYTIDVDANGAVTDDLNNANRNKLVTGLTVHNAISDVFDNLSDSNYGKAVRKQAIKAVTVSVNPEHGLELSTMPSPFDNTMDYQIRINPATHIAKGNQNFVTSGLIYDEVRPTQGNYINGSQTVAQNLQKLDGVLSTQQQSLNQKLDRDKITISTLKNENTELLTVNDLSSGDNKHFVIGIKADGTVDASATSNHLVTGKTVHTALQNSLKAAFGFTNSQYRNSVRDQAQAAVKVAVEGPLTLTPTNDATNHTKTYTVGVKTDGTISDGDTGLVTGGTVYNYVKDFATGQGYATTTGANIDVTSPDSQWFSKLGTTPSTSAVISDSNTHFVSGKEIFKEVRVQNDLTHVKKANSVAANLEELDKALNNKLDKGSLGGEVGQAIQNSVSVEAVAGELITVTNNGTPNDRHYHLSLKTTESQGVTETDNALVTRNTLKDQLAKADTDTQSKLDTKLATKANLDASNLQAEQVSNWQAKLGNGAIATNNQGLVTGKTVYDEVRVKADGNHVKKAQTAGENLTALDNAVVTLDGKVGTMDGKLRTVRNDLYGNTADSVTPTLQLAKSDLSNLTSVSEAGMVAIGKSLKFNQGDFVNVGFDESTKSFKVTVESTGTETTLANNKPNRLVTTTTLNSVLEQNKNDIQTSIGQDFAKIDASNIKHTAWLEALGTQPNSTAISNANDRFVTGKEVYEEVRPTGTLHYTSTNMTTGENIASLDGKLKDARKALYGETDGTTQTLQLAKNDLSNLTAEGKTAISQALTFEQGDFVNISFDQTSNRFKVAVTSTGDATSLDTTKNQLVTSKTLNSVLTTNKDEIVGSVAKDFAKVDASNITTDAWHTALGATAIDGSNKGFVSAKQVFDWGNPGIGQFNVIQGGKSVGENLVLIDKTLGEHATSIESLKNQSGSKPNFSVANNGLLELKQDADGNYVLDLKQGDVTNSPDGKGAGVVTGEKVQTALDDLNTKIDTNIQTSIQQKLEGDEFKNLVNNAVDQTIINQKVDAAMQNLVTDQIAQNDKKAVTSGAVHNALYGQEVQFGQSSLAKGQYSVAIGYNSQVNATKAGAMGVDNSIAAGADNSYVVGMNNKLEASAKDTFVLGSGVTTGASNAVILGAGSEGVSNAVSVGSSKNKRKVVNVADGLVAQGSSEAVTGGQLYETQQAIANNQRSINQVANTLHKEINRAAANSAAMAALQPIGLDDEHHWSAAAGVGHYSGEQAVAVGLFYKPTQNFMVNMGGSTTVKGDPMLNLGVSYRFGAPYTNDAMTTGQLQQKVVALNNQNLALEAQLESAKSREDNMAKRVEKSKEELEALRAEIEQMKELLGLKAKMKKTSVKH